MNIELKVTADGSHTLYVSDIDETYHSSFGAIQESQHIFIENGLKSCKKSNICIYEVGFGTGLNAFLAFLFATKNNYNIHYITVEKYPLGEEVFDRFNFPAIISPEHEHIFREMHTCLWNEAVRISDNFILEKILTDLTNYVHKTYYDVIFFDAFSPEKQPEMWSEKIFQEIFDHSLPQAVLTTYCAKGNVRRALQSVGFTVERLPGPPGKREILRAVKLND